MTEYVPPWQIIPFIYVEREGVFDIVHMDGPSPKCIATAPNRRDAEFIVTVLRNATSTQTDSISLDIEHDLTGSGAVKRIISSGVCVWSHAAHIDGPLSPETNGLLRAIFGAKADSPWGAGSLHG